MPSSLGLCSVTFRDRTAGEVVDLVRDSGLSTIEWAEGAHISSGNIDDARALRRLCEERGLAISGLGSYFRSESIDGFDELIETALALGAPRLRLWAGRVGSADATTEQRRQVIHVLRECTTRARGVLLGLEFHTSTLNDTAESSLALLDQVGSDAVATYWQPPLGMPDAEAIASLRAVMHRLCAVHAFSWWPLRERHSLDRRADLWRTVARELASSGVSPDVLLEFVSDDSPDALDRDAATLARLFAEGLV